MSQETEKEPEELQEGAAILSEFSLDPMTGMLVDKQGNPMPPAPQDQEPPNPAQQQQQPQLPVSNCT